MARVLESLLANGLTGRAGNAVFVRTKRGVVVRSRVVPRDPRTAEQEAVRARMRAAVEAWRALSPEQAARWAAYAAGQREEDPRTGAAVSPSAYGAFVRLATRFQRVSPGVPIPADPPEYPFAGDEVRIAAEGAPGEVVFRASGPTSGHVRVELFVQPLRFAHQSPQARGYRSRAYAAFAEPGLEARVAATSAWAAPAYRFVDTRTGQVTALVTLPVVPTIAVVSH